jgi:uncharacterized repeat protein (TIGR01451 family)
LNKTVSSSLVQAGTTLVYNLNLTVTGATYTGVVLTDTLPANVTYVGPGTNIPSSLPPPVYNPTLDNLTWVLPSLAPGNYDLSYQTEVNTSTVGGTVLTNRAVMTSPGSAPVTSAVPVTVFGSYTVKIGVYNEAGELIDTILTEQLSAPIQNIVLASSNAITSLSGPNNAVTIYYAGEPIGVWTGVTSAGTLVTNGAYYVKVDNISSAGAEVSTTQEVTVNRTLYTSTILIYNEAGEVVKHLYAYTSDPGPAGVASVQLSATVIQPGSPGAGTPTDLTISLSNGTTVVWDGTSDNGTYVQSGEYLVEVHTTDGSGGEETVVKQVTVDDRNTTMGAGTVTAWPNVLKGESLTTTFDSNSSLSLTLNVSVYTVAGELVTKIAGQAGINQAVWNASGLASGVYLAVVDLVNSNGNSMGRQILKVAVIR